MSKSVHRGYYSYENWLLSHVKEPRPVYKSIDIWIASNKKKKKRQPRLTGDYDIPRDEILNAIEKNEIDILNVELQSEHEK